MGWNSIVDDKNPNWWHLGKFVQIKNRRVWETQDRIGIVQYGDSSEESRTWLSQIEDNGEKKFRAEFANEEFWSQKRKLWDKGRGQESGNKTAWTKKVCEIVGNGNPTGSVLKETIAVSDTMRISVQKTTQPNPSTRQDERNASRTRSPRGKSPSGRMFRLPCKD